MELQMQNGRLNVAKAKEMVSSGRADQQTKTKAYRIIDMCNRQGKYFPSNSVLLYYDILRPYD